MEAYKKGDAKAFDEIYERYSSRLNRFIRFRLSQSHINFLDDLFQITWLKIHRARKDFNPESKFSSWAYSIAINTIRDHFALRRFKKELIAEDIDNISDVEPDPTWKIDFEKVRIHLNQLPAIQREVLLLSDLEGFSSIEISQLLSLNSDAVRKIISRARKKIKESLEGL